MKILCMCALFFASIQVVLADSFKESVLYTFENEASQTGQAQISKTLPDCDGSQHATNAILDLNSQTHIEASFCGEGSTPNLYGAEVKLDGTTVSGLLYFMTDENSVAQIMQQRKQERAAGLPNDLIFVNGDAEGDCLPGTLATLRYDDLSTGTWTVRGYCLQ